MDTFKLKIEGEGAKPESLTMSHLAEMLKDLEKMILSESDNKQAKVSLLSLTEGSVALKANILDTENSLTRIIQSIKTHEFDNLKEKSIASLKQFIGRIDRYNWTAKLSYNETIVKLNADLLPLLHISKPTVRGRTTIYGMVVRIGDKGNTPTVTIKDSFGVIRDCTTTHTLITELQEHKKLYHTVQFDGIGGFDFKTLKLKDFFVEDFNPNFNPVNLSTAIAGLKDIVGEYFHDIDPDQYIQDIREE